jgi:hypothetical protein
MLATHLGFYNTASSRTHVRFQFSTHAAAGGNVAPNSAFEAADIRIYRANDGAAFSATQRSSANGITMTSPFDSLTGFHDVDIDLTDNTDAGFYAAGYQYSVVLAPDETVDGQTLTGVVLAYFEIAVPAVNVTQFGGTAGTFASGIPAVNATQISGDGTAADNLETLLDDTAGSVPWAGIIDQGTAQSATGTTLVLRAAAAFANDELIGATIVITGGSAGVGQARVITDYVNATDTATVDAWTTTPTGTITYKIFATAPGSGPTDASIADAVWDELLSGHAVSGSAGEALSAAGTAGDPWTTALPGAYGSGTAGKIIGDNINATISSRATQTSVDDLPTNAELTTALGTADDAVLAQVALVKAKTDNLPSDPADQSLIIAATDALATLIGDVPTNAELATALGTADDAVLAQIADLKSGIIYGAAATGTLSTTQATSNLTGYADDQLIGRVIIWLTGNCEGEATDITDYASASGLLTFTALTTSPANGDTFKVV